MTPSPDRPGVLNWVLICLLGVIWGSAFVSMSMALDAYSPLTVAALRTLIASLAVASIGYVVGQPLSSVWTEGGRAGVIYSSLIAVFTVAAPFLMLTWGLQFVPSAFAGVAMGSMPLLILPLAYVFAPDEGVDLRRVIGVSIGFVGLIVLIGPSALRLATGAQDALGQLACVGAACSYAVGSIMTRKAPKMPPVAFAAATLVVGAIILVPLALIREGLPDLADRRGTLAVLYLALFPTGLAGIIRLRVITTAGSVFMSLTNYQVPVWSIIFGILILGEDLPTQLFVALAIILLGIAIAQSKSLGSMFKPAAS